MPTYQYACTECHDQFEVVQKFTDDALTECPHCAGRLRKVFSAVGVVFKGSGFYRTDSRSGSTASGGSSAPSSTPAAASAGSDGASSTPAPAPSTSTPKDSGSSSSGSGSSGSSGSTGSTSSSN